ncbi:MAG: alpha/beta fold hydrolase [Firmicutes bacterium]|nr:alpha/beta fold hydrolase [Bacillota bacterium]
MVSCDKKQNALPPLEGDIIELASKFVEKLATNDFAGAVEFFDATMLKELPEKKLEEVWQTLLQQVGAFQTEISRKVEEMGQSQIVILTAQFELAPLDIRMTFNQDKRIIGLFFVPAVRSESSYKPPAYGQPANFTETEVMIGEAEWQLPGTLTIPNGNGPFPAVVLVHGSGPNDRDETIGITGAHKPFKDLAWGLANQGIAVLRYDKRTMVYGEKINKFTFTVREESIDDALAAVELLRNHKQINNEKIYILGHSLGGILAPRIGKEAGDRLAGLIILAGPARPLEDLILEQTRYLVAADGETSEQEAKVIRRLETQVARIKDPALSPATPAEELLNAPASYWLDLRNYKPTETAAALKLPMLILQGERDYQVTMEDFALWQQALASYSHVQFKSYPGLNHLFVSGQEPSVPSEYEQPGNVEKIVIDDIAAWIRKH